MQRSRQLKKYVTDGFTRTEAEHCFTGYIEMLRFELENAFKGPIELMNGVCTDELRAKRQKTGRYLLIHLSE